ncbi:MAG: cupredoxin domain-containing protein [Bacteroidales bacterium]|nr:cupredoxin domain-containing protein [Bacteroidales bacterium]MCF8326831.1 cupredoxin domain-containing protein [Bacteroidales bacterium]
MNKLFLYALLILSGILLAFACQKKGDVQDPEIEITQPESNSYFSVPDSIHVKADIRDNENIKWVQLSLVNKDQTPVAATKTIQPIDRKEYHLDTYYHVEDILLNSGEYYMQVRVSDGTNTRNGLKKVYINEAERKLKYFLIVTASNPNQVSLYSLDSSASKNYITSEPIDYFASTFHSRNQQLIIAGKSVYGVKAFHAKDYQKAWNFQASGNPVGSYFRALTKTEDNILLGIYNGEIIEINKSGNKIRTYDSDNNLFSYQLLKTENFLIAAQQDVPANKQFITSFFPDWGGVHNQQFSNFKSKALYPMGPKEVLIPGNHNNQGGIWQYDLTSLTLWKARSISQGKIHTSCQISDNDYLIAGNNQIYWYQVHINSLTTWKQNTSVDKIYYDELTNSVITVNGQKLRFLDFPIPTLKDETNFSENIHAVHPVYNK